MDNPKGRRMKVVKLSGAELWDMFRGKMAGVGVLMRSAHNRRKDTVRAIAFSIGLPGLMLKLRKRLVQSIKMAAFGSFVGAVRQRRSMNVATRVFFPGFCAMSVRWLQEEEEAKERQERAARMKANRAKAGGKGKGKGKGKGAKGAKGGEKNLPKVRSLRWETMDKGDVKGTIFDRRRGSIMPGLFGQSGGMAGMFGSPPASGGVGPGSGPTSPGSPPHTL